MNQKKHATDRLLHWLRGRRLLRGCGQTQNSLSASPLSADVAVDSERIVGNPEPMLTG
jgi:hypothetical protein